MCNCMSYNLDDKDSPGKDCLETLSLPNGKKITVDHCIKDLIFELNINGIKTLESCCGHEKGDSAGYILLDWKVDNITIQKAIKIVKRFNRSIPIISYQLIYHTGEPPIPKVEYFGELK